MVVTAKSSSSSGSSGSDSDSSDSNSTTEKELPIAQSCKHRLKSGDKPKKASPSSSGSSSSDSDSKLPIAKPYDLRLRSMDKPKKASPSSSESSSSDSKSSSSSSSSGSESEGSQSDDEFGDAISNVLTEKLVKAKIDRKRKLERDSSRTLTSGNNSDASKTVLPVTGDAKEKESAMKKDNPRKQGKESSDSDSTPSPNSGSDDDASKTIQKIGNDKVTKKRKAQDDSSSKSSISDSSSDFQDSSAKAKLQPSLKRDAIKTSEVQVTKKLRTSENGAAISTATTQGNGTTRPGGNGSAKNGHKSNMPFQRFDSSKIPVHAVKDNRYEAKAGPSNDYGQRAHKDLIVTRGAGFRKEKNKKKRGSYKGGEITLESHSFKFS